MPTATITQRVNALLTDAQHLLGAADILEEESDSEEDVEDLEDNEEVAVL